MIQRRTFLQLSTGVILVSATGPIWSRQAVAQETLVERARAAGEDRVVVGGPGGVWGQGLFDHFYTPFTEATGIEVQLVSGSYSDRLAQLVAMHEVGKEISPRARQPCA